MNTNLYNEPVGLTAVKEYVKWVCANPMLYKRGGDVPNHLIVNLDSGNGQTTLTEYIANSYKMYGIRHFGGLDTFLEFTLDGSKDQLFEIHNEIEGAAVYTNKYEGVVAMNVAAMADHVDEVQMDIFLKEVSAVAENATVIFYVPAVATKDMCTVVRKIREVVKKTKMIQVDPYIENEVIEMIYMMIDEVGVDIEDKTITDRLIFALCSNCDSYSVASAKEIAQKLIRIADYSKFIPIITNEAVEKELKSFEIEKKEGK